MKKYGKGWVVLQGTYQSSELELISIVNPRRTGEYVKSYMAQAYADRHYKLPEKLLFKKHGYSPHEKSQEPLINFQISYGYDPFFVAYKCDSINYDGTSLHLDYTIRKLQKSKDGACSTSTKGNLVLKIDEFDEQY